MRNYQRIKLFSLQGVPVYMHWPLTVIVVAVSLGGLSQVSLIVGAASFWGIMLIHELGHMYLARRYGLEVFEINLSLLHGNCAFEKSELSYINYMVAWGGIFTQFIVAIPCIIILYFLGSSLPWFLYTPLVFFGYISVLIALINLAPSKGLDGYYCWRSLPIYLSARRKRSVSRKKRAFNVVR